MILVNNSIMAKYYFTSLFKVSCVIASLCYSATGNADALTQAIQTNVGSNQAAAQSQQKIDQLSDQTRSMLDTYRQVTRQTETLKQYNAHLKQLLDSQEKEKLSMQRQLQDIQVTQREVVPLMTRMLETLDKFIKLDSPFLPAERQRRITQLKDMVVQANVTDAEKFRRILEAYQVENDYGYTIEAYRGELALKGAMNTVDFFRLGRVALFYQTLDGSETGSWSRENKQWTVLDSRYRNPVRNGLRMARKETAPDLISLPLPTAEAAQ